MNRPKSDALDWVKILASNLVTVIGAYFVFAGTATQVEPQYVQILQDELQEERAERDRLQAANITLTLENAELAGLTGGTVTVLEAHAVWAFLDEIQRPAWCKRVEIRDGEVAFVMAKINDTYALRYQISAAFYEGRTDFESQDDQSIAQAYYDHDFQSYTRRHYLEFFEPARGASEPRRFAKWWFQLPSGQEYICGMEVGRTESSSPAPWDRFNG